eukprot:TRINITY_DN91109_c0_g1_i1.p1 TRINITY_DN91109_c0_g1~~TRINITY_DN91109_c0_g1_i1.p1  ORF type:complete len:318 (-),score=62.61 TRINITY_DN91109_c0_g1_i1:32-985(-)
MRQKSISCCRTGIVQLDEFVEWLLAKDERGSANQDSSTLEAIPRVEADVDDSDDMSCGPSPLIEGDYIWKPAVPMKMFKAKFGDADWADDTLFEEVQQLTLSHFLGWGAAGTVYKASYENSAGEKHVVAVKFVGVIPECRPDSHTGIDMLMQRDLKRWSSIYEAEKGAFGLLRTKTESHWHKYTHGHVRMLQMLGFHDAGQALLVEYISGSHPESGDAVMESVQDLLQEALKDSCVEVGDVKLDNLIQDELGVVTIIDFGCCQYCGGASCKVCKKSLDSDIDEHAQEHVSEYMQKQKARGPLSRLRLQEFCFGRVYC